MPVKITILSGARQGQTLETGKHLVAVGDQPTDDIAFDAESDSGIRERRATLKLESGSWKIYSSGSKPIFVNQDLVNGAQALRSGDIVRMSHDGPDFCFDLLANVSESAPSDTSEAARQRDGVDTQPESHHHDERDDDQKPVLAWPLDIRTFVLASLVLIAVLSAWGLSAAFRRGGKPETSVPRFHSLGVLHAKEGETVLWKPTLEDGSSHGESLRFQFVGDVPRGMTIDGTTGSIKWATTEEDGPGEYRCDLMVYVDGAEESLSDTATLEIQIKEVNRPPVPARLATQEVNLRVGNELRVELQATDSDAPTQKLSFDLSQEAPEGVLLDPDTGQLIWEIPERLANQNIDIPFRVTDDATERLSADGIVRVHIVSPDPWSMVEQQLRDSVYLLAAKTQPGQSILPLGTASAIAEQTLLTSATVASGAHDASKRGWTVLAVDTRNFRLEDPKGIEVKEIRSHAGYVHATDSIQQAYFDLALLTTDEKLPSICQLGDVETSVTTDQEVACFGYEILGGSLSRFDRPQPMLTKTTLWGVIPPPNATEIPGRTPYLLQLKGQLPFHPFGSLVVNQDGAVLGIYAFRGELPENSPEISVHYAPDIMLASAFLAGSGERLWVAPKSETQSLEQNNKQ